MNTIKIIKKISKTDLTRKEKIRIIGLGLLETIVNSYKLILKLPFFLIGWLFVVLSILFEFMYNLFEIIATICQQIVLKIDMKKDIQFVPKTDREKIIKKFEKSIDKYKAI